MDRRANQALVMILALLLGTSMLAVAAETMGLGAGNTARGTVEFVDARTGLLWIRMPDGTQMRVVAPTSLLDALQQGGEAEIALGPAETRRGMGEATAVATVQTIDPAIELLRLLTVEGEIVELRPMPQLITDLQTGDEVTISVYSFGSAPQARTQRQDQQAMADAPSRSQVPSSPSEIPIPATVERINQQASTVALMTDRGERIELQAPEALLSNLQEGDSVEISIQKAFQAQQQNDSQTQPQLGQSR